MEALHAWRPTRRLPRLTLWVLGLLLVVLTPLGYVAQSLTAVDLPTSRDGEPLVVMRLSSLGAFVWLLAAWLWAPLAQRRILLTTGVGLAWALLSVATLLVLEVGVGRALRETAATAVQAGVALAFYRWRVGDDDLTPHRPRDVTALFQAALLGTLVATPLTPIGDDLLAGRLDVELAAWLVLGTAYVFVGASCLLLLVQRRPRAEAIPTRLGDVYLLLVLTGLAVGVELTFPGLPLSWAVLLPAIWAGLLMGPWSTAALGLTASLAVLLAHLGRLPALEPTTGTVVALLISHCMMVAFVLVALVLALVRDQRAHLAQEVLQRRQHSEEQAGLLSTLVESLDEALLLLDAEGRVQLHNRAARTLLGEERLTTEPRKWLRHRGSTSARFSYSLVREGEDTPRIISVQLAPVPYAGADGVMAVARDVTSEHRRIEELASFAAVAAHDLKSPLAAVEGWLEVAQDVVDTDVGRARHALDRGRAAAARMSAEIDDWLAYTVAREGELSPEPVPLTAVLEEIAATHPGVDFGFETPQTVQADRTLLRHLLANLIGNAVKYTRPGESAHVRVSSTVLPGGWVQLQVVDRGIGIPAGEETAVFEPFRRATTVTSTYEGSGLGLALCKRIVRRHGGSISATRNEGGPGTTITVTLPGARVGRS